MRNIRKCPITGKMRHSHVENPSWFQYSMDLFQFRYGIIKMLEHMIKMNFVGKVTGKWIRRNIQVVHDIYRPRYRHAIDTNASWNPSFPATEIDNYGAHALLPFLIAIICPTRLW